MEKIEYDKDIDLVNIEIFGRTGTDNVAEKRYRCVLCKNPLCHLNILAYCPSNLVHTHLLQISLCPCAL